MADPLWLDDADASKNTVAPTCGLVGELKKDGDRPLDTVTIVVDSDRWPRSSRTLNLTRKTPA